LARASGLELQSALPRPLAKNAAGGLIAGILDAADGFVAYYFAAGFNPIQVLQFDCLY